MWVGEALRRRRQLGNNWDLDTEDLGHPVKASRLYLQLSGEPLNGLRQGWHYRINGITYFSTESDLTFIPLLVSICLLLLWFVRVSPLHLACKIILMNIFGISMTPKRFSAGMSLVAQMVKNLPAMQNTWVWSPGEGIGNPLQYSCLENPMDRGTWWPAVHGVTKSWTWLSN